LSDPARPSLPKIPCHFHRESEIREWYSLQLANSQHGITYQSLPGIPSHLHRDSKIRKSGSRQLENLQGGDALTARSFLQPPCHQESKINKDPISPTRDLPAQQYLTLSPKSPPQSPSDCANHFSPARVFPTPYYLSLSPQESHPIAIESTSTIDSSLPNLRIPDMLLSSRIHSDLPPLHR
jgi:hypothetical protein